jgi:DNA-binding HxlR family transcriptional regulator
MIKNQDFFLFKGRILKILSIVSKKGSKEILLSLEEKGKLTYTDIESLIGNPRTTSKRLNELCSLNIIKREVLPDKYRSVSYSLTPKGKEIVKILIQIQKIQNENAGKEK